MGVVEEVQREHMARIASLRAARDMLEAARYPTVASDGQDIFNAAIDTLQSGVDDLISSFDDDDEEDFNPFD